MFVFRTGPDLQRMSITGLSYAVSFAPKGNPSVFKRTTAFAGTRIGSGADATTFSGKLSNLTITPDSFTARTEGVIVEGVVTNFDDVDGCKVAFRAAGARRPD